MNARSASVRPSFISLFSWGSVPGSPGEVRAFLQRRISIYLVFTSAFWATALLLATLLTALTRPEQASVKITALLLAMVLALAALWWLGRRKERSTRWLFIVDLAATTLQGALISLLLLAMLPLIRYRPDLIFIHGVTCVLVARASVVPSTPGRTVLVGVLACVPVCLATLVVYRIAYATRDIKPSNIFICERGLIPDFVKVLDFGLARDVDSRGGELTQADQLTGTPLYMCPEQIRGATLDGRSDLYPVGALAYFLLTGTPVFSGATVVEICSHHLHSAVELPSKRLGAPVPPALESAVLACLEKAPTSRPQDATAAMALFDAAAHAAPWTQDDSRRWWLEHGPELRASRQSEVAPVAGKLTLEVAIERRLASI